MNEQEEKEVEFELLEDIVEDNEDASVEDEDKEETEDSFNPDDLLPLSE